MEQKFLVPVRGLVIAPQEAWIRAKEEELRKAEEVLRVVEMGRSRSAYNRVKARVNFLRKVVSAFKAGYLPVPRFHYRTLRIGVDKIPFQALAEVKIAEEFFDEIGYVPGVQQRGEGRRRDPLIVGIVRGGYGQEFHFLIYWWMPEYIPPAEMV